MNKYTGPVFKATSTGVPGYIILCKDVPDAYWKKHQSAWKLGPVDDLDFYLSRFNEIGPQNAATSGAGYNPRESGDPECKGTYARTTLFWIPAEYVLPELNEYGLVSL